MELITPLTNKKEAKNEIWQKNKQIGDIEKNGQRKRKCTDMFMENAKYGRKSHRKAGIKKSKILYWKQNYKYEDYEKFFKEGSKNFEHCSYWIEIYMQMLSTISFYEQEKENFRKKYGD